ncbi:mitochondrial potassium channel-like isoform X2 [Patiria miniata]|nr:mitochondrial potassium channel-like isoform X2 [Patiria miniata]
MEVREILKKSAHKLHNHNAELRAIRAKLDQTARDDTKFLEYVKEEHLAIQKERKMEEENYWLEDTERNTFAYLSAAVRESHEKQRLQGERSKYLGVIFSFVGSIIGLLGSIIGLLGSMAISRKRRHEKRTLFGDLQKDIGQNSGQLRDLQGLVTDIRTTIDSSQLRDLQGLVTNIWTTIDSSQLRDLLGLVADIRTTIDSSQLKDLQGLVTDIRTTIDSSQLRDLLGLVTDIRTTIDSSQLKNLQGLVTDIRTTIDSSQLKNLQGLVTDIRTTIDSSQLRDLQGLVTDIRTAIDSSGAKSSQEELTVALERFSKQQQEGFDSQERSLTRILKLQEELLLKEIEGVRRFAAVGAGDMTTLEELVNNAEPKLGQKTSTLSTVVYGGLAVLTLSILYRIFKS